VDVGRAGPGGLPFLVSGDIVSGCKRRRPSRSSFGRVAGRAAEARGGAGTHGREGRCWHREVAVIRAAGVSGMRGPAAGVGSCAAAGRAGCRRGPVVAAAAAGAVLGVEDSKYRCGVLHYAYLAVP
jgi:hypothetical protein